MAERTKATVLKTVVLRTPVNEWLDPIIAGIAIEDKLRDYCWEDRSGSRNVGGFPKSKNKQDPSMQTMAMVKNGMVYEPVLSRI